MSGGSSKDPAKTVTLLNTSKHQSNSHPAVPPQRHRFPENKSFQTKFLHLPSSFQILHNTFWIYWEVSVEPKNKKLSALTVKEEAENLQAGTHLPGLTQSAHCWVTQSHDDGKEGI